MRILVFGDSTAQGYYDLEKGGWVNLLFLHNINRRVRRKDIATEVFNVSVSGDTTRDVMNRLGHEVKARQWEDEPIALVFAVGVNDSVIVNGEPAMSLETYQADLEELYALAKQHTNTIVFVGLEAVDESESAPWLFNSGTDELVWKNERIQEFDQALEKFAREKGVRYVPVFDEFRKRQEKGEKLHADGLHPNAKGHDIIFREVLPVFEELAEGAEL